MNRHQKIAWFTLIMAGFSLGLSVVGFGVAHLAFGLPVARACGAFGFVGLFGFTGLSPLLFRREADQVAADERDFVIRRKAMLAAYTVFWLLFVAGAMVPWCIVGPNGVITVNYLPWMVFAGMYVVTCVQSVVILGEYGWRGTADVPDPAEEGGSGNDE